MNCYTDVVPSPIGALRLCVDDRGRLVRLDLQPLGELPFAAADAGRCAHVAVQLRQYFAGERRTFALELAPAGTAFQQRAWQVLQQIPFGQTISYAAQAMHLGKPGGARAVGTANAQNPIAIVVPCHRVVGRDGSLCGYAGGLDRKRWLLEHERAAAPHLASAGADS